jgi:hypothetical protein
MAEIIPNLAILREAAEAAGPVMARALVDLLQEYVQACDDLEDLQRAAAATLATAEQAAAEHAAAGALIQRYRVSGAALVLRLRERQRRDPFRLNADLNGLRRAEDRAITTFHGIDARAVADGRDEGGGMRDEPALQASSLIPHPSSLKPKPGGADGRTRRPSSDGRQNSKPGASTGTGGEGTHA